MAEIAERVTALSEAAWRLRHAAPRPSGLPFALALFSDPDRMADPVGLARQLPELEAPLALIFRHDRLEKGDRLRLADRVRREVQARGHLFLMARGWIEGADGCHAFGGGAGFSSEPVHDEDELVAAVMRRADLGFLSPLHPTASHPGKPPMPRRRAVAVAQASPLPLFALGGMNEARAAALEGTPFQGFGAISAVFEGP